MRNPHRAQREHGRSTHRDKHASFVAVRGLRDDACVSARRVRKREEALRGILLGTSDLAEIEDGRRAVEEAIEAAKPTADRLGFGFVRNLGFDYVGVHLLYVVSDGTRQACVETIIPDSLVPLVGEIDDIDEWVYERLYRRVEGVELDLAYKALLQAHPIILRG